MERELKINGVKVCFFTSLENGNNAFSFRAVTSEADANYDLVEAEKPYTMNDIMYRDSYVAVDEYYVSFSDFIAFCVKNNVFDNETAAAIMEAWNIFLDEVNGTNTEVEANDMVNDKNYLHCKAIAEELEKVASGEYFLYEGELYPIDTEDFSEVKGCRYDEENNMYIMPDGEELCEGDVYPVDILEYLGDGIYDVEYTVGGDKQYRGVRIMVACGGPNIYIDTNTGDVELYWGNESARYPMSSDVVNYIDSVFEETFACM